MCPIYCPDAKSPLENYRVYARPNLDNNGQNED